MLVKKLFKDSLKNFNDPILRQINFTDAFYK